MLLTLNLVEPFAQRGNVPPRSVEGLVEVLLDATQRFFRREDQDCSKYVSLICVAMSRCRLSPVRSVKSACTTKPRRAIDWKAR